MAQIRQELSVGEVSGRCRRGVGEVSQKHPQVSQIDQMNKIQGFGAIPDTLATPLRHPSDTLPTPPLFRLLAYSNNTNRRFLLKSRHFPTGFFSADEIKINSVYRCRRLN